MKKFLGWGVSGFIALALIGSCMDEREEKEATRGVSESGNTAVSNTERKALAPTRGRGSSSWQEGVRIGEASAKAIERSIKDQDPPITQKQFRESAQTTADNFRRQVENYKNQMAQMRELGQKITDANVEVLARMQDLYDGFMSKAGKYVR